MYLQKLRHGVAWEAYLKGPGAAQSVKLKGVGAPWDLADEEQTHVQACSTQALATVEHMHYCYILHAHCKST